MKRIVRRVSKIAATVVHVQITAHAMAVAITNVLADTDSVDIEEFNRLKKKHERLLSLLTAKGVLAPGEIDGIPLTLRQQARPKNTTITTTKVSLRR